MNKNPRIFFLFLFCLFFSTYSISAQEFESINDAIAALQSNDWALKDKASEYLVKNQNKEVIRILEKVVKDGSAKKEAVLPAMTAVSVLARIKDDRIVPLLSRACYELLSMLDSENESKTVSE